MIKRNAGNPRGPIGPNERLHERRRRELIDATIESISVHGLTGTTVARVAERARLSVGIISFYFDNKDALLLASLHHLVENYDRAWRQAVDRAGPKPEQKLEALIDAVFDSELCNVRTVSVWTAFWGEATARREYSRVCGDRDRAFHEESKRLVAEIAARPEFAHVDADAAALGFIHMVESLPEWLLDEDADEFSLASARCSCRGLLSSLFPGADWRED